MNETEETVKEKLLAEFREWFCAGYCRFYGTDSFCSDCPIKDGNCWLNEL